MNKHQSAPVFMSKSKHNVKRTKQRLLVSIGTSLVMAGAKKLQAASASDVAVDPVVQVMLEKGLISSAEAQKIEAEIAARQTNIINQLPASKWNLSDSIKSIGLFGDVRLRYEYRGVDNPSPQTGATGNTYNRERFRYALRFGVRGELKDDFSYGVRLETSANPRSPWVTFADDTGKTASTPASGTPSDKSSDGINVGQVYLGWHPTEWFEASAGKMPMPLYTTPMVWDSDINPEGAFEKVKFSTGNLDLFADFGQFDYQDPNPASSFPSSDTFMLAWQAGGSIKFSHNRSFKMAPVLYTYTGHGSSASLNTPFVGQGNGQGLNSAYNQSGINDLLILEIPMEYNFRIEKTPLGTLQARLFGDLGWNFEGDDRARAAYAANPIAFSGRSSAATGQNLSYQLGFGIGNVGPVYGPTQGLVYGSTSKKNTWEARVYWQHIEQYALDVNLIDSDFFEGRANLQGIYGAFAYSFTDAIIGTFRYGYANQIVNNLGTGGSNLDLPGINPIKDYNLFQLDLTWRF
jgi:hypothetical protein